MSQTIFHIDGDAFFASCEQARDPFLKGKPVVVGADRRIAAAMSYEAKARGVKRAMHIGEIKKICPEAIILNTDFAYYSLVSEEFYKIVKKETDGIESSGIDECFAVIKENVGDEELVKIGMRIKTKVSQKLGITVSVGIAKTKVLAKLGSKFQKPDGLTLINESNRLDILGKTDVGKIWGIGYATTEKIKKDRIKTALQFISQSEGWIKKYFNKPTVELWHELNGRVRLPLGESHSAAQKSISKARTFIPATSDKNIILSEFARNIENACIKARRHELLVGQVIFFVRTSNFESNKVQFWLPIATASPSSIIKLARKSLPFLLKKGFRYRQTGVVLSNLTPGKEPIPDLFDLSSHQLRLTQLLHTSDKIDKKYGKHTVFITSSLLSHKKRASETESYAPKNTRRLNLPMFSGTLLP
ncbi:MAG: DNA polymerase IV [Patescibacteria group bacterium]